MLRVSNYGSRLVPRNLVSRNPFLRPCTAAAQAALEDAGVQKKAAVAMVSTFPLRKDIQKLIETTKDNALAAERRDKEAALAAQRRDEAAVLRDKDAALAAQRLAQLNLQSMIILSMLGAIVVTLNSSGETLLAKLLRYVLPVRAFLWREYEHAIHV